MSSYPCAKLDFRAAAPRKGTYLSFPFFCNISVKILLFTYSWRTKQDVKYAFLLKWKWKIAYFRNSVGSIFCCVLIKQRAISECLYLHSGVIKTQANILHRAQILLAICCIQLKLQTFHKNGIRVYLTSKLSASLWRNTS